jgi:hypothetical protein
MREPVIKSVEDNLDEEAPIMRPLQKNHLTNRVAVARAGVEAVRLMGRSRRALNQTAFNARRSGM